MASYSGYRLFPEQPASTSATPSASTGMPAPHDQKHEHRSWKPPALPPLTPKVSARHLENTEHKLEILSKELEQLKLRDTQRHPDSQLVRSEFGAIQDALTAGSTWNGANRGVHLTGVHPSTYNPMHGYMSSRYADSPDTQRYFDQDLLHRLQNGHPSAMYSLPSSGGLSHYPSNGSIPFLPYAMRNGQGLHDFDPRYSYAHPRAHQLAQIPAVEVLVVTTNDIPGGQIIESRGHVMALLQQKELKEIRAWMEKQAPLEQVRSAQVARFIRQEVHDRVVAQAQMRGCNAIVNFSFDSELVTDENGQSHCSRIRASGLAVVFKRTPSEKEKRHKHRKDIEDLLDIRNEQDRRAYHRRLRKELSSLDPEEKRDRIRELIRRAKGKNEKDEKQPSRRKLLAQLYDILDPPPASTRVKKKKGSKVRFQEDESNDDDSESASSDSSDGRSKGLRGIRRGWGVDSDSDSDSPRKKREKGKSNGNKDRSSSGWDPSASTSRSKDKSKGKGKEAEKKPYSRHSHRLEDELMAYVTKTSKRGRSRNRKSHFTDSDSTEYSSSEDRADVSVSKDGAFNWALAK